MKKILIITASFCLMAAFASAQTAATPTLAKTAKGKAKQANTTVTKPEPKLAATQTGTGNTTAPVNGSATPKLAAVSTGKKNTAPKKQ